MISHYLVEPYDSISYHWFGQRNFPIGLSGIFLITDDVILGWKIRSESGRIPQLFRFRIFRTPEFSSEFYFSDCKMCSRQLGTRSLRFGILSHHQFFWFHESKHFPAMKIFLARHMTSASITQSVDPTIINHMDVGTTPGKAILMSI